MKNVSHWKLIAILVLLVLIFAGIRVFRTPALRSNLPEWISKIDTSKVTGIIVVPRKENNKEIQLLRKGSQWSLKSGDREGHLEQGGGLTALQALMGLRPQSVVTKRPEKWDAFDVGDSTGTQVKVMQGESVLSDLWIGRTGFVQSSGGVFGGGFTYVRRNGENEVYTVEAFLEGQFNRSFNDWRDKSFARLKKDSVDKISFLYPADSSFVLERRGNSWKLNNERADSSKVDSFLSGLTFKNLAAFSELAPSGLPATMIVFEKNGKQVLKLEAWTNPGPWILRSSLQPDTYFLSEGPGLNKDIWKGKTELKIPSKNRKGR